MEWIGVSHCVSHCGLWGVISRGMLFCFDERNYSLRKPTIFHSDEGNGICIRSGVHKRKKTSSFYVLLIRHGQYFSNIVIP